MKVTDQVADSEVTPEFNIESLVKEQLGILLSELEKLHPNKELLQTAKSKMTEMTQSELFTYLKDNLLIHHSSISKVAMNTNSKVKSKDLNFLKSITLFGVDFKDFHHENKNTKKTIVRYFTNVVTILSFSGPEGGEINPENFLKGAGLNPQDFLKGSGLNMDSIQKIANNKEIMKLAEDFSKDIERENINPMDLMNGLMSGNFMKNEKISGLINSISSKLEGKIKNGELDIDSLGLDKLKL